MTKAMNIESIEKATGKSWPEWLTFFEAIHAQDMSHSQLAHQVYEHIVEAGLFDNKVADAEGRQNPSGWWSQNVTVAYEQHIGKRAPGQREDGTFEVAITKTLNGSMDDTFAWWVTRIHSLDTFNGQPFKTEPTTSQTEKRRHWAVNLTDGTRITADASPKSADKTLFAVTVMKLKSSDELETWRMYWKKFLA